MTLDAMHWVWNHSRSRGNARLAMLFVADRARTSACEARLSYADFMGALNASRSVVKAAVKAATESGELTIVEQGRGTRPSLYSLPKAVGFVRPASSGDRSSGPESGPLAPPEDPPSGPDSGPLGPDHDHASGPDSGPEWAGFRPSSGPDSGPHKPIPITSSSIEAQEPPGSQPDYGIPINCRPLVDAMTRAGLGYIPWPFEGPQWFPVESLIQKCGVQAMTDYAVNAAARTKVSSARYFMPGWQKLPPLPPGRPPARDSPQSTWPQHCGDCDPQTRQIEIERDGLPALAACPNCHPGGPR